LKVLFARPVGRARSGRWPLDAPWSNGWIDCLARGLCPPAFGAAIDVVAHGIRGRQQHSIPGPTRRANLSRFRTTLSISRNDQKFSLSLRLVKIIDHSVESLSPKMSRIPGNPSMAQRIARVLPGLTRAHRGLAEFVLAHPLRVATMPIDELAAATNVSVATANRFARALEFDGYPQFRAALVLGFESTLAPVEKLRDRLGSSATAADVFGNALAEIAHNIESTRSALDADSCEKAVDMILKARRVYIVGYGASSWLAGLLQRNLERNCDYVQPLASIESASYGARALRRLRSDDLLIALSFPRYFADTVTLAGQAGKAGVPVLALTDRVTSPVARLASVALYAHTESQYFANSEASALALIEGMSSAVALRAKDSLHSAAELAEVLLPWLQPVEPERRRSYRATPRQGGNQCQQAAW